MTTTTTAPQFHQRPSFGGRLQAGSGDFAVPDFVTIRRICKQELLGMGERCSTRRAHRLAEVVLSILEGGSLLTYSDPTGEQAVKNVLRRLAERTA